VSQFLTQLREELVDPYANDGTGLWAPTEIFSYYSSRLKKRIDIPVGFVYDHASVPRLPLAYAVAGNRYHRPALIHDWLCRMRLCKRETADLVFLEAMMLQNREELAAMKAAGKDDEEMAARKAAIDGRAQLMYLAVAAYTKTGLWKSEVDAPGHAVIG
jgi:hypothetical protein